jgi:ABC-type phosphate/phosphonate transport system substrate-binding protein
MALIAALGMYDRPETMGAHDKLWALMQGALRDMGLDAPDVLTRGDGALMPAWLSPDLLFAQTCSLPYRAKLAGKVTLIATPDYGLEGCPAGHYRSVYVARRDDEFDQLGDVSGLDFAYNEALSHSGWAAPYADHAARGLVLRPSLRTGSHYASALAVAQGRADYAALDALSWAMMQSYDDFTAQLEVIDVTPPSPALPYITAKGREPAPLRAALGAAITALPAADRAALHLHGLVDLPEDSYLSLPIPPAPHNAAP